MRRRGSSFLGSVGIAWLIVGCNGSSASAPHCVAGVSADGTNTFSVGTVCLRGVGARVRRASVWTPAAIEMRSATLGGMALRAVADGGAFEALAIDLPDVPGRALLQEGYQSWSFSGATVIPETLPLASDGEPRFAAAATGLAEDEVQGVSYGFTAIADDDAEALVIGATSAARGTLGIAATRPAGTTHVTMMYGASRERLESDTDGTARSEWIYIGAGPLAPMLTALRDEISSELPAGTPKPSKPPGGWYSWNQAFASIDAGYISSEAAKLEAALLPLSLPLVEIDDGWEKAWGDWQTSATFGTPLEALGPQLTAKGMIPGVWLAPFLVDVTSDVGKTIDPALLVHGPDGAPLIHTPTGNSRRLYILDGTNPRAMAIAGDSIRSLAASGFGLFKLDFLYAGALPGVRSENVTGTEALRRGLGFLRAAAGPNAVINACGAPILPLIGIVDSLRVGADTVFTGLPPTWGFVAFAARNLAARSWLAPLVWPDADQAVVRDSYTTDEARVAATVAALAGPAYSLGDDLVALPDARLSLAVDPALLDLARADLPGTPEGVFANPANSIALNPVFDIIQGGGTPSPRRRPRFM